MTIPIDFTPAIWTGITEPEPNGDIGVAFAVEGMTFRFKILAKEAAFLSQSIDALQSRQADAQRAEPALTVVPPLREHGKGVA